MASPTAPTGNFIVPRLDDTQSRLLWKIAVYLSAGLGISGVVTASGTQTGRFAIFHAFTDSVINATYSDGTTRSAIPVGAGDRTYGDFVSVTLVSGTGELYKLSV